jgi:hypothetical protein
MQNKRIAPTKVIRYKCLDCCAGDVIYVKCCPSHTCPLWKFRLGKNPFTEKNSQNPLLEAKNFIGKEKLLLKEMHQYVQHLCKNS